MQKSWLEKAKEEAIDVEKPMMLPFRYKNDKSIYAIMDMDDLADLIVHYKALVQELDVKEEILSKISKEVK